MTNKLKEQGFTLILSGEYGNISGGYLKATEDGVYPSCLEGNEIGFLSKYFSNVLDNIKDANKYPKAMDVTIKKIWNSLSFPFLIY